MRITETDTTLEEQSQTQHENNRARHNIRITETDTTLEEQSQTQH